MAMGTYWTPSMNEMLPRALTPRMERILARASEVATSFGQERIGAEHVAVAMLQDSRAIPTAVLGKSVDVELVVAELLGVIQSESYGRPPPSQDSDDQG